MSSVLENLFDELRLYFSPPDAWAEVMVLADEIERNPGALEDAPPHLAGLVRSESRRRDRVRQDEMSATPGDGAGSTGS